jgi:hypothetical protein
MEQLDSAGKGPAFLPGDRVYVGPIKMEATVIRQVLHHDGPESFWGNLELLYDDGVKGESHCWQVKKIEKLHPWDQYEQDRHPWEKNYEAKQCKRCGEHPDYCECR